MTDTGPGGSQKSDFIAAEEIKEILKGRNKEEQERIVRWVSESLGLIAGTSVMRAESPPAAARPQDSAGSTPSATTTAGRPMDIRTFVQEKQPKSDVQFVAVAAYFLRFMVPQDERKETISSADLQTAARQAQRAVFKTPSLTLNNAVQLGYLDRAGRGEYRLNAVGENLVAMTLPGAREESKGVKKRARKRRLEQKKKRA